MKPLPGERFRTYNGFTYEALPDGGALRIWDKEWTVVPAEAIKEILLDSVDIWSGTC